MKHAPLRAFGEYRTEFSCGFASHGAEPFQETFRFTPRYVYPVVDEEQRTSINPLIPIAELGAHGHQLPQQLSTRLKELDRSLACGIAGC